MIAAEKCKTCSRDPKKQTGELWECSHPDCPHRRRAWSDRPPAPKTQAVAKIRPAAERLLDNPVRLKSKHTGDQ